MRVIFWIALFIFMEIPALRTISQVAVNHDGSLPDNSAMLDIKSTSRGLLIPRMTSGEILAIPSPPAGMMVFCTTDNKVYLFVATSNRWKELANGISQLPSVFTLGSGGICGNSQVSGPMISGIPMISFNYVDIPVNVTTLGPWSVNTDTVNGIYFNNSGTFSTPGPQTIRLNAFGTPLTTGSFQFTAISSAVTASCSFQVTFQSPPPCGTPFTDTRNGKTYNTVLIFGHCWMTQNINIGNKVNMNTEQTNNGVIEKSCYNNDESNCTVYGGLYQWAESIQYLNGSSNNASWNPVPTGNVTGICPTGWHIASQAEFEYLNEYLGGASVSGGKMKETGTTHWWTPNTGATNTSGFTALPTGNLNLLAGTAAPKQCAYIWTSTQNSATDALGNGLYYNLENLDKGRIDAKTARNGIRCVK